MWNRFASKKIGITINAVKSDDKAARKLCAIKKTIKAFSRILAVVITPDIIQDCNEAFSIVQKRWAGSGYICEMPFSNGTLCCEMLYRITRIENRTIFSICVYAIYIHPLNLVDTFNGDQFRTVNVLPFLLKHGTV